ncbi:MAG: hypothetical protein RJA19_74 [Bacteroidota bacterium]|jgi:predicted HTH transcriptional regulator
MSYVLKMIEEGEHQRQDFKTRVDDARKIARTLVAFANSDGGRLLIGVRDDGSIAGVREEEEWHMIQEAAQAHCKPPVPFEVQVWKADFKTVLEVQIPRSAQRPHFCESEEGELRAYLRQGDQNLKANAVLVKVWQYEMRADRYAFRYDRFVGKLFKAWRDGRVLAFGQVARIARIDFAEAEDLLCLLMVWNIIEMVPSPRGFQYRLRDEAALDRLEQGQVGWDAPGGDLARLAQLGTVRALKPPRS